MTSTCLQQHQSCTLLPVYVYMCIYHKHLGWMLTGAVHCISKPTVSMCMQANKPEFHQLDEDKFLRQQLAGKVVIEFPVLIVLLPGEIKDYSVVQDTASMQKSDVPTCAEGTVRS